MIPLLLSAFLVGLAGSFHCAGMCGPIAIALPLYGSSLPAKFFGGLLYNLGRTLTYVIMGALFGLIGLGLHMMGFQQIVSIVMGAGMIILALLPRLFRSHYKPITRSFGWTGQLKTLFRRLFSVRSYPSLFFVGMLNGLLPCGLVYVALAGAIASGTAFSGSMYMLLFGLGTIPMLLFIALMGNVISVSLRHKINRLIPVLVVLVGIFFILRGLNLGIPFLSPTKQKIEMKFEKSLEDKEVSDLIFWNEKIMFLLTT
ncbi:MAG TPA: sulfite exporter TauE/SafE family protein [Prolixibacteraceae bacterium]|nr:sulfite exporter TauE/SafE family protein [Prolixibacteraceae bacterium]